MAFRSCNSYTNNNTNIKSMKKLIFVLLIAIQAQAQTFDFNCEPDFIITGPSGVGDFMEFPIWSNPPDGYTVTSIQSRYTYGGVTRDWVDEDIRVTYEYNENLFKHLVTGNPVGQSDGTIIPMEFYAIAVNNSLDVIYSNTLDIGLYDSYLYFQSNVKLEITNTTTNTINWELTNDIGWDFDYIYKLNLTLELKAGNTWIAAHTEEYTGTSGVINFCETCEGIKTYRISITAKHYCCGFSYGFGTKESEEFTIEH